MRLFVIAAFAACVGLFADPVRIPADQFLEQVVASEVSAAPQKAKIYFSPGKSAKVPYSLQRLMVQLAARGVEVEGTLVSAIEYQKAIEESAEAGVAYELAGFESMPRPSPARFVGEALGVPLGVAPLNLNPATRLKDFGEEERQIFYETAAIHNLVLLTGLQLADKLTLIPAAILSTYFYQVFANLSEILKFKGQGTVVVRDGDSLKMDVNPYFLTLVNLAEEVAINGAVGATIPTEGGLSLQSTLSSAFAFGLAKTSVDRYAAQMEKRVLAAKQAGKNDLAESLKRRQLFIMKLFFNGVVPVMRTLAMLTERTEAGPVCSLIKGGVMALAGCHAIYKEVMRMGRLRFLPSKTKGPACAQALVVFSGGT